MKKNILSVMVFVLLILSVFVYMDNLEKVSSKEAVENAEQAIQKAAITCYAIEGTYPTLEYLEEHYGIVLFEDEYYYHYEAIGSNILPIIKVLEK